MRFQKKFFKTVQILQLRLLYHRMIFFLRRSDPKKEQGNDKEKSLDLFLSKALSFLFSFFPLGRNVPSFLLPEIRELFPFLLHLFSSSFVGNNGSSLSLSLFLCMPGRVFSCMTCPNKLGNWRNFYLSGVFLLCRERFHNFVSWKTYFSMAPLFWTLFWYGVLSTVSRILYKVFFFTFLVSY